MTDLGPCVDGEQHPVLSARHADGGEVLVAEGPGWHRASHRQIDVTDAVSWPRSTARASARSAGGRRRRRSISSPTSERATP
jgi:hypothetical protein